MGIRIHQKENVPELQEIDVLSGFQRMLDEEWNDVLQQMFHAAHPVRHSVAVIRSNHSATEVCLEGVKHLHIALVLHDGEFRKYLEPCGHFRMGIYPHVKATFTVHEACNPLRVQLHWTLPNI
jgi:hypothetical protein